MNAMTHTPNRGTRYLLRATTIIAMLLAVGTTHAAKDYTIELVLFKYSRDEYFNNEHWPKTWPVPDIGQAVDLDNIGAEYRNEIRKLGRSQRTLNAIVDSLVKSSRYDVLVYTAWRQPGLDKDDAVEILIQAGSQYERQSRMPLMEDERPQEGTLFLRPGEVNQEPNTDRNAQQTGASDKTDEPLTETYRRVSENSQIDPANRVHELEGTVKIVLSRFLHIYTDLLLMEPVRLEPIETRTTRKDEKRSFITPRMDAAEAEPVQRYRITPVDGDQSFTTLQGIHIQQHRRMRSKELHHLDHPLLGTIVKVTPVEE